MTAQRFASLFSLWAFVVYFIVTAILAIAGELVAAATAGSAVLFFLFIGATLNSQQ